MQRLFAFVLAGALVAAATAGAAEFVGVGVCVKCHDMHGEGWETTTHAKAFETLKPGARAEAKAKAKLDPNKDYSADGDCVGCHSTGFGQPGGYQPGGEAGGKKMLGSVGCESCHGAGGDYRDQHGKADKAFKRGGNKTPRASLAAAGQNFDYEAACARCHLNYPNTAYKEAKAPYTPFTPAVDPKYGFDYAKSVRASGEGKPLHVHYKLTGVFEGNPVPPLRDEFQKTAKDLPQ